MSHRAANSFSIVIICIVLIAIGGALTSGTLLMDQAKRNFGQGEGVNSNPSETIPEAILEAKPAIGALTEEFSNATSNLTDQIIEYDYIVEYYVDDVYHPQLNESETEI